MNRFDALYDGLTWLQNGDPTKVDLWAPIHQQPGQPMLIVHLAHPERIEPSIYEALLAEGWKEGGSIRGCSRAKSFPPAAF